MRVNKMKKFAKITAFFFMFLLLFTATNISQNLIAPASAEEELKISAIVNDEVITIFDLVERLKLFLLNSRLKDNPENRNRFANSVLKQLTDEILQMQEAKKLGLLATNDDIRREIINIEDRNKMVRGQLFTYLKQNNVGRATFVQQARARLSWINVLRRKFAQSGGVSGAEIEEYIANIKAREGKREILLREIYLEYPSQLLAGKIKQLSNRILQDLKNGHDFAAIASNLSNAYSAREGGMLGWVLPELLPTKLADIANKMQKGQISAPIETLSGLYILNVEDSRILSADDIKAETGRDLVEKRLIDRKVALLDKQEMHRLRVNAFIEQKLQ